MKQKIKMWIFTKLFRDVCRVYENEIEKKNNQIHNLRERNKFLNAENEKYRIKSNWIQ